MQGQLTAVLPNVFPVLRYPDADAAIEWLKSAFGFEEHVVFRGEDGAVFHGELKIGTGIVMLGTEREDVFNTNGAAQHIYVSVEDTDAHYARAKAAGTEIGMDLHTTDYGSREYSARDLEGNIWSFGTYNPHRQSEP